MSVILARLAAVVRQSDTSDSSATDPARTAERVLVVDDSETHLQLLHDELGEEGFAVSLARSGTEALDRLAVEQVDCILLDLPHAGPLGRRDLPPRLRARPRGATSD